ncbi:MAG: cob(I)yrinic acid a,c-diamide adenosyltransferase [Planctomycetes bacterium]|nr:cob(I)yrinic acid a,c-diamide adenosyltransferase [Planctomycetota bacterium]
MKNLSGERNQRARARILVFTGPGKGKTTAAIGMAVRFVGHGRRVLFVRFAKTRPSGEVQVLSSLPGVTLLAGDCGMSPPPDHPDFPRHQTAARRLFVAAQAQAGTNDLLVLDELCGITARGMVAETEVVSFLARLRADQTAVLTGRGAGTALIAAADTVSSIESVKHAYHRGIAAQPGIEY